MAAELAPETEPAAHAETALNCALVTGFADKEDNATMKTSRRKTRVT